MKFDALTNTTKLLREIEFSQVIRWKQRTRLIWLGFGDASSKYFFNSVKQKQKRETMTELILDSGELITDELKILEELTNFYQNLYKTDNGFETTQHEALTEMMSLLEETISPAQLMEVEKTPTIEELEQIMKILANNKAPGSDGLTSEVIRNCWEFMKTDILNILIEFWETEKLYEELLQGIIRLLPKKLDKRRINDWRPLTLLQIVYKLISKLIAI
jgi:hypothetical protein